MSRYSHVAAVIPARGGSRRIKQKNLAEVGGQSLVARAIATAAWGGVGRIIVSTDDRRIAREATSQSYAHVDIAWRPAQYSTASADIVDAVAHAAEPLPSSITHVAVLQPTLPLRPRDLLPAMIERLAGAPVQDAISAVTMLPVAPWLWCVDNGVATCTAGHHDGLYVRSQELDVTLSEYNAITVNRREVVQARLRWGLPLLAVHLPPWAAVDIDDEDDLAMARDMDLAPSVFGGPKQYDHTVISQIGPGNHHPDMDNIRRLLNAAREATP